MDFKPDLMRQGSVETRPARREFAIFFVIVGCIAEIGFIAGGIHLANSDGHWGLLICALIGLLPVVLCSLQIFLKVGLFQGIRRSPVAARMSFIRNHAPQKLYNAAKAGDLSETRKLLDQGAPVNAKVNLDRTPLMAAAEHGACDVVELLISNGAMLNERNHLGKTALVLAVYGQHAECVRALVDSGADLNVGDNNGRNAVWWARSIRDSASEKYLLSKGARDPDEVEDDRVETSIDNTVEVGAGAIEIGGVGKDADGIPPPSSAEQKEQAAAGPPPDDEDVQKRLDEANRSLDRAVQRVAEAGSGTQDSGQPDSVII